MLDFTTFPGAEDVTCYAAGDPLQDALRARLAEMTETEVEAVERDIDLYQRMGFMARKLQKLLDTTPETLAA